MGWFKPDICECLQFDDQGDLVCIFGQTCFQCLSLVEFMYQIRDVGPQGCIAAHMIHGRGFIGCHVLFLDIVDISDTRFGQVVHQAHAYQAQGIGPGFHFGHDPGDKQGTESMFGNRLPAGT